MSSFKLGKNLLKPCNLNMCYSSSPHYSFYQKLREEIVSNEAEISKKKDSLSSLNRTITIKTIAKGIVLSASTPIILSSPLISVPFVASGLALSVCSSILDDLKLDLQKCDLENLQSKNTDLIHQLNCKENGF